LSPFESQHLFDLLPKRIRLAKGKKLPSSNGGGPPANVALDAKLMRKIEGITQRQDRFDARLEAMEGQLTKIVEAVCPSSIHHGNSLPDNGPYEQISLHYNPTEAPPESELPSDTERDP
jgi:hypothetical protein